ncbi:MAG: hypothetical protein Q7J21_04335 [Rugosibacter sp.]|nr:hypothetical protein [Rugosibacter sp.]
MKVDDQRVGGNLLPGATIGVAPGYVLAFLVLAFALLLTGCGSQKTRTEAKKNGQAEMLSPATLVMANNLRTGDIQAGGVAIITPSSATGQEEDKQALALAFTGVLREALPELRVVSLPETLSAINRVGLTNEYKKMFEDYRLTGIFERDTLQKVAKVTGSRYIAQLKLGAFRQESKGRWGLLGVRVMETKSSTIRLFLQIWDSHDGSIAWEGSQESTLSHESVSEEYVPMKSVVEESTRDLVRRFP